MSRCPLLPVQTSPMVCSATMPTVPKMMPMARTDRIIVQTCPAGVSGWTSRKPVVVSVMTAM